MQSFVRDTSGNVAVIFALTSLVLFGLGGVALDYTRAGAARQEMQTALDAAVLGGIAEAEAEQVAAAARIYAAERGIAAAAGEASFTPGSDGSLTGTARRLVPTTISRILGREDIAVTARSVAVLDAETSDVCILLVDPDASQSLLVNSKAAVDAPTCEVHVRSTGSPAAIVNSGTSLDVKRICVKGGNVIVNGGADPPLETSCDAIADPFAGKLPVVDVPSNCTIANQNYNPNVPKVSLPAGNVCSTNFNNQTSVSLGPGMLDNINFNGQPTINLSPGLYIIRNTVIVNSGAKLNGTDVTFYFADANSRIQFNGNVTVNLSAPKSGTYSDILFFEPQIATKGHWVLNGSAGSSLNGLIYLPSRNVIINSVSNVTANRVSMVFNTLIMNAMNWSFETSGRKMSASGAGGDGTPYLSK